MCREMGGFIEFAYKLSDSSQFIGRKYQPIMVQKIIIIGI